MLPTKRLAELKSNNTGDLILAREEGVVKTIVIPEEFLSDKTPLLSYKLDRNERKVVIADGDDLIFVTDEIGITLDTCVSVVFIDSKTMLVKLVSGTMYLKNSNGVKYAFDDTASRVSRPKPEQWLNVDKIYEIACGYVKVLYHITSDMVKEYVYNSMPEMTLTYEQFPPSEYKQKGVYLSRYGVSTLYTAISCGEFDFIMFEKGELETGYKKENVLDCNRQKALEDMTDAELQAYEDALYREQQAKTEKYNSECDDEYDSELEFDDDMDFDDEDDDDSYDDYDE